MADNDAMLMMAAAAAVTGHFTDVRGWTFKTSELIAQGKESKN